MTDTNPKKGRARSPQAFTPEDLDRTTISLPLLKAMKERPEELIDIIIDANLEYAGGRKAARVVAMKLVSDLAADGEGVQRAKTRYSQQYVFAKLRPDTIRKLARADLANAASTGRAIYKIWEDSKIQRFTNKSVSTVKADAARNAFGALGHDIVWAVIDTGVDASHPHFTTHRTLELEAPLLHRDFTDESAGPGDDDEALQKSALVDGSGHGTHVAGIIAGEFKPENPDGGDSIIATIRRRDETGEVRPEKLTSISHISGMAPQCRILSLKVLDSEGEGLASNIIAALEYIQDRNSNGRRILIHGVNLSVGYDFEPKWFACGQSPLCVEVDRLVRSGVVVVVAAGNTGYGYNQPDAAGPIGAGLDVTINDPGNADLAITVGSTHREMPHIYGVSYFSSKGPTGDGRLKPDLLAPGERIISCQSSQAAGANAIPDGSAAYHEDSGTSMAAPHVSGVIAAFLSVRREFIGRPDRVKRIFMDSATDLGRAVYFQGKGLVDLMRAIQSV